jgi:two-component system OmpR family response regulator
MGPSVLVVCGDDVLCAEISAYLAQARINVQATTDPGEVEDFLNDWPFDIAICDVELPGGSGCELISRLRLTVGCGLIAVSSAHDRDSRKLAMRLGADNFAPVPIDHEELEAMLRNLHRRVGGRHGGPRVPAALPKTETVKLGAWRLDLTHWTLTCPKGQGIQLSFPEYRILQRLATLPGEVVTRSDLTQVLDEGGIRVYGRNLDMMMSRLRRKVQRCCEEALPVHSARGVGYVFNGRTELSG